MTHINNSRIQVFTRACMKLENMSAKIR